MTLRIISELIGEFMYYQWTLGRSFFSSAAELLFHKLTFGENNEIKMNMVGGEGRGGTGGRLGR